MPEQGDGDTQEPRQPLRVHSTILATGTSTGAANGPFNAAALSSASNLALTLTQTMAAGSVSTLPHYQSRLTCTNAAPGSTTPMPSNVVTTSYNFGSLQFGDIVSCTFVNTPYPHLTLRKLLGGTGGRQFAGDQFTLNVKQGATTLATTTTTGTTTTVNNGVTPQVQVAAGTAYTFVELPAGTTVLAQYTAAMACSNAYTGSTTALPAAPGGSLTPQMGDVITCTITNTKRTANATLVVTKSSTVLSDPVNGTTSPMAIPGAVVRYTITVSNTGPSPVDSNTVFIVDSLPNQIWVGTASAPAFTQGTPTSGLTFSAGTDIRYSNAANAPASFAACTYTPTSAYDPAARFICINPKGILAGSTGTPPNFSVSVQSILN